MMFTYDPVDDLIDTLRAGGIRADVDIAKVNAPGVWVQPTALAIDTLASTQTTIRLVLVAPDKEPRRAYRALVDLLNKVTTVVPIRAARNRTVLMPDGAVLPALETEWAVRAPITD